MHISKLSLINFKNYEDSSISLHRRVNCFVGNNGVGKTNLLDAVHYICMCKSYFQSSDRYNIRHNQDFMMLQANIINSDVENEIYCGLKTGKRKIFRKNKKEYAKLSDHVGQFPVVMVSPSDSALILDGSEERRRYMNAVISQFNHEYLEATIRYNKILSQRNKLLKEARHHQGSSELLDVYDSQISPLGQLILEQRLEFVKKLSPIFQSFYNTISQGNEKVEIRYSSQLLNQDYMALLKQNRSADFVVQHTTVGIHKDDLVLVMDNVPIKKVGSQGQQKTFLVALKLAQFNFLRDIRNVTPFLLLDDIFDKFDENRVKQILKLVTEEEFGQIFITHTNKSRMTDLLIEFKENYNLYVVADGKINTVKE